MSLFRTYIKVTLAYLLAAYCFYSSVVYADEISLVVYPQSLSKNSVNFLAPIIKGITATNIDAGITTIALSENDPKIVDLISGNKLRSTIALGKSAFMLSDIVKPSTKRIFLGQFDTATITKLSKHTGLIFTPNPGVLFKRLHDIVKASQIPKVKQVHVVYNEGVSGWLVEQAKNDAAKHNIILIAHPTSSLSQTANIYTTLLPNLSAIDAIWLLNDRYARNESIIELIVRAAWEKRIAVFSSRLADIKSSVLFSAYPNLERTGSALSRLAAVGNASTTTLRSLHFGLNSRVAAHIGVSIDVLEPEFMTIYPKHVSE